MSSTEEAVYAWTGQRRAESSRAGSAPAAETASQADFAVAQATIDIGTAVVSRLQQLEAENVALRSIATQALERAEQVDALRKLVASRERSWRWFGWFRV